MQAFASGVRHILASRHARVHEKREVYTAPLCFPGPVVSVLPNGVGLTKHSVPLSVQCSTALDDAAVDKFQA